MAVKFANLIVAIVVFVIFFADSESRAGSDYDPESACNSFHRSISSLRDGNFPSVSISVLREGCSACASEASSFENMVFNFFEYHNLRERRDFPNSMATVDEAYRDNIQDEVRSKLEKLIGEIRSTDEAATKTILQFFILQNEDISLAWTAFELLARLDAASYGEYELTSGDNPEKRRAWHENRERWIAD